LAVGERLVKSKSGWWGSTAWLSVLAALGMAGHGMGQTVMGPVLAQVMAEFGVRETAAGVLLAAGSLGFMSGCLISGFAVDRAGLKPVLLGAWVVVGASLGGLVLSPSFLGVVACYFIFGMASGFVETSSNVLPTQIGGGATMMNLVHMGYGVGALAAPLVVASLLRAGAGWRSGFVVVIIMAAVLLLLGLGSRLPEAPGRGPETAGPPASTLLRSPLVLSGGLALLFYVAGEMGMSSWSVLSMQSRFELDAFASGTVLSLFWGAILVGRLVQGAVLSRFSIPAVVTASGTVCGLAIGAFALSRTPTEAYVAAAVAGLAAGGIYPDVMAYINGRFPGQVGAVTGLLSTVAVTGSFLVQPTVGRVAETAGLQAGLLLVAGAMLVSGLACLPLWLGRERERPAQSGPTP